MGKYDIMTGLTDYKSTFVDPGVENFKEVAKIYRETYDRNEESTNLMLKTVNQMDLMKGDEAAGLRDSFRDNISASLGSVIEQGNYEDASLAVNDAYRYLTSDMSVIQAQKNAAEYKKDQEYIQQFGMDGVVDFNDGLSEVFSTVDPETGELRSYTSKMEQKGDYAGRMQSLLGNIAEDMSSMGPEFGDIDGDQVMDYLKFGNTGGVSSAKLDRVVEKLYNTYTQSSEGAQDFRRLTQTGRRLRPEDAKADILQRFRAVGSPQVGSKTNYNYDFRDGLFSFGAGSGGDVPSLQMGLATQLTSPDGGRLGSGILASALDTKAGDDGSVPITRSGSQPLIFDLATRLDASEISGISTIYGNSGLANDTQSTNDMTNALLRSKAVGDNIDDQLNFIYKETGVNMSQDQYNTLYTTVNDKVLNSKLGNMGALMSADFTGKFTPSANDRAVPLGPGQLAQFGTYEVTEEQLNDMAAQAGLGDTGKFLWMGSIGATDIDRVKDAQGNKIFTEKVDADGNTVYTFQGYSPVVNTYDANTRAGIDKYDIGTANYAKNKPQLVMDHNIRMQNALLARDAVIDLRNEGFSSKDDVRQLEYYMTTDQMLTGVYQKNKGAFISEFTNHINNGGNAASFYQMMNSKFGNR